MFCHHCGIQIDDTAQFCKNCGQPVTQSVSLQPEPASRPQWVPPPNVQAAPGRWLGAGWEIVKADLGNYLLISLIFILLNGVPFIQGALIAGFHIYTMKKLMRRPADIGDLFKGFNYFLPTLVATVLIGVFTFIGFLFLVIPGLIVAAMYKFTYLFIVDKRMGFWQAMQASHAVVRKDYFGFVMFLVLAFLLNVVGFCCLIVGLMVTLPLTFAAITAAYSEIVGFDPRTPDLV
ncbi:MAG: zinc-ribbon domain-containing protein [Acidobacteriia bacterium]|nr:zinc-ribbon domain-containing protein [Terriglobia bacterium]